jgi:hypothetical protein
MVRTLLQERHLTFTVSAPSSRSNFLEPHDGQIGHARRPLTVCHNQLL